ncbi:phosphoribosyltransferase [Pontibacter sp. Tf4]|uniref:phosphoribosyltransferase n=1 Tax=Pontibacter sp. Tf4 TaxID=2761620 RepID=UPI001625D1A7|nr:phosphoribosyltransferase family protein [Pontibacter sp. Tf4]MBB6612796.1 phosphoribosyltransferase [Pontibacter sp. Tf4]
MIRNREEAAELLAAQLANYKGQDGVVLAIPRGGVPVAAPIARYLHMPLDLALVKKIGHPANPEYAIGAVSLNSIITDPTIAVPESYVTAEAERVRESLREKYRLFMGNRETVPLQHKVVIIVDDGIATGKTLQATIALVKVKQPAKVIVAVPVAPPSAIVKLKEQVDEVICLLTPPDFQAVGQFYKEFTQTTDQEVITLLKEQGNYSL